MEEKGRRAERWIAAIATPKETDSNVESLQKLLLKKAFNKRTQFRTSSHHQEVFQLHMEELRAKHEEIPMQGSEIKVLRKGIEFYVATGISSPPISPCILSF
uniref:Uncharacterized protein n=1 Tax=Kalanchoe fedtschenkoi TaxID=63787 RepID=A0A7N0VDG7_KALFE